MSIMFGIRYSEWRIINNNIIHLSNFFTQYINTSIEDFQLFISSIFD